MKVGICGPNDHHYTERDYQAIRDARFELIKTMSFTVDEVYRRCREINPQMEFIVRLYSDGGGHPGSPERFVEMHAPRMEHLYRTFGITLFQIHNEPNHLTGLEGWGQEKHHAGDFSNWFIRVYSLLKARCPWARLGFPGLAVPHKDKEWLDWCRAAILMSDWLGLHIYWQTPPGHENNHLSDYWGKRFLYYSATFPSKDIHILEYGNSNGQSGLPLDDHERARQYVEWFQMARKYSYLKSASSFILSSPDPRWHREGFGWADRPTLIAAFRDMPRGAYVPAPTPPPPPPPPKEPTLKTINMQAAYSLSREGQPIKYLVLHGANGPASGNTHSTADYLAGRNAAGVSAHELVGYEEAASRNQPGNTDFLYIFISQGVGAHTVGFSRMPDGSTGAMANRRSYNIEAQHHVGRPMHPRTYAMLIERAVNFCIRNGWTPHQILNPTPERAVLGHYEVDTQGKTCPGPSLHRRMDAVRVEIADIVRARTSKPVIVVPPPVVPVAAPIPEPTYHHFSLWVDENGQPKSDEYPGLDYPTGLKIGEPLWIPVRWEVYPDGKNQVHIRTPHDHLIRVVDEATGRVVHEKEQPRVITLGGRRTISLSPGHSAQLTKLSNRWGWSHHVWFEVYWIQAAQPNQRAA
jgi:hypothetical protein